VVRVSDLAAEAAGIDPDNDPVSVVSFPVLHPDALQGTAGGIVDAVMPYTEAHPAAVLATLLARFGTAVGNGPHVWADNRKQPCLFFVLVVGKTASGAKGTSSGVVNALFCKAHGDACTTLKKTSGLSTGEGLLELIRDGNGDDPNAKNFDEGVWDKRIFDEESEFGGTMTVMERPGNSLSRIMREAWEGGILRTVTRGSPLTVTGGHVGIVAHITPGELKIKLSEAQLSGGTVNRFLPIASKRTKLCPDGGNIPEQIAAASGQLIGDRVEAAHQLGEVKRTEAATELWRAQYGQLRRDRPDGQVAQAVARAAPQVLRLSLGYALLDGCDVIDVPHLKAALALWQYVTDSAEWMFGVEPDDGVQDALVAFIAAAGASGRSKTEINVGHFQGHKKAGEIDAILKPLLRDGRIRQEVDSSGRGRAVTRYYS
jgi:hypothetical protein